MTDWLPGFRHWALAAALELLAAVVHVCHSVARSVVQELLVILRDALALFEREPPAGAEPFDWRAVDLHRVAPAIPGLWRDALAASRGFVYRDETRTRFEVDFDVVVATLAHPDRVEMHP